MEELTRSNDLVLETDKENIMFNLGGVLNHEIYFNSIGPNPTLPNEKLLNAIKNSFGSYDDFKKTFKNVALMLKGSGYTFLVIDKNHNLQLINFPN